VSANRFALAVYLYVIGAYRKYSNVCKQKLKHNCSVFMCHWYSTDDEHTNKHSVAL